MACTLRPSCGCRAAAPLRSRRAVTQPLMQLLGSLCCSCWRASARLALQGNCWLWTTGELVHDCVGESRLVDIRLHWKCDRCVPSLPHCGRTAGLLRLHRLVHRCHAGIRHRRAAAASCHCGGRWRGADDGAGKRTNGIIHWPPSWWGACVSAHTCVVPVAVASLGERATLGSPCHHSSGKRSSRARVPY